MAKITLREKERKGKKKRIRQTVAKIAQGTFKGPSTILHYQFTSCVPPVPSEPGLYGTQRLPEAERTLSQVQAGVGGRLHKGIFGTRWQATICVKVQLGDTRIRTGKGRGSHKGSSFGGKEQIKGAGAERGLRGKREKQEAISQRRRKEMNPNEE